MARPFSAIFAEKVCTFVMQPGDVVCLLVCKEKGAPGQLENNDDPRNKNTGIISQTGMQTHLARKRNESNDAGFEI